MSSPSALTLSSIADQRKEPIVPCSLPIKGVLSSRQVLRLGSDPSSQTLQNFLGELSYVDPARLSSPDTERLPIDFEGSFGNPEAALQSQLRVISKTWRTFPPSQRPAWSQLISDLTPNFSESELRSRDIEEKETALDQLKDFLESYTPPPSNEPSHRRQDSWANFDPTDY